MITALLLALMIAGIAGTQRWFDAYGCADDLDAALVYPAGGGAQVVVLDRVSHHNRFDTDDTPRLNLWAPGEDSPRLRVRVPGARMLAADARSLWLYSPEHGVHARDPATLAVRVDEAGLLRLNPALAAGLMPPDSFEFAKLNSGLDEATGRLVVTTKDGRRFAVDPESFAAEPFSGGRVEPALGFSGACPATPQPARPAEIELRGDGPRQEAQIAGRSAGEFLAPERLAACHAETSPGPDIALLLHRGSLDEQAPSRLTAFSPKGEALWTATLTGDSGWEWVRVLFASVSGEHVILVVQGGRGSLSGLVYGMIAVNRADGRIASSTKI